jgi:hypothetical protein
MPDPIELEKDEQGNVILHPLTGWRIGSIAKSAVLLAIQYSEGQDGIEIDRKLTQVAIEPHACLELCQALSALARKLLGERSAPAQCLQ